MARSSVLCVSASVSLRVLCVRMFSSELDQTVRRIEDLKNKPELLKIELRQFVSKVPADHSLDVRADKKLFDIMMNLAVQEIKKIKENPDDEVGEDLAMIMQAVQRLLRVRSFYAAVPKCSVVPIIQALQIRDPDTVYATLQAISQLLWCRCPADKKFDTPMAELAAKQAFFESKGYDVLINRVLVPYGRSEYAVITAKVVDMLAMDLVDNSATTRFIGIQKLLQLLTPQIDLILFLTTHTDLPTRCYASILLQGYLLHSSLQTTQNLQSKVLEEGHLLYYILFAVDGAKLPAAHPYAANWYDKNLTELARNLLGLLCAGNPAIVEITVQKTIPKPLQVTLESLGADSVSNVSLSSKTKADKETIKNTLWNNFQSGRMKRVVIHPQFQKLDVEVREPHVLWTLGTKAELCLGLLKEIEELQKQKEVMGDRGGRWDYEGWEISYKSLDRYLRVGGFYISLLLPVLADKNSSYVIEIDRIHMLLAALFQRSVTEDDPGWKLACLRTMSALYEKYGDQLTKDLEVIPYFSWLIDPKHTLPIYRDHILKMLQTLLKDAGNVRRFVKAGGVTHLLWYISRVLTVPDPVEKSKAPSDKAAKKAKKAAKKAKKAARKAASAGSSSEDSSEEDEEEKKESDSKPVSPNGVESEDANDSKQNLLGGLPHPLGVPETASLCISLLKLIQAAGPKMKRVMGDRDVVNTLTRLLMCPVPGVREEGIRLLLDVLDHSTHLVPRLITTGLFSFLVYGLRYGTSPAALELLSKYHLKQDRKYVPQGESALAPFFPRALAEVLKTQGVEAFGQLFDSRDASSSNAVAAGSDLIWNPQLKKHLLDVMSRRLGSFRALLDKEPFMEYKFSLPEPIRYPSIESEIEIAGVSLRQLNETGGLPDLLAQLEIPNPDELMEELVASLSSRRFAGIDLLNILTAQVILIKSFPELESVLRYQAWEALYEIISEFGKEQEFPMIEKSSEIVHVLLSPKVHPDDEDENLASFIETKGVSVISKALEYFSSLKVANNILIQRIIIDLLNVVYDIGLKAPEVAARDLSSSSKKYMRNTVLSFLGSREAQSHAMLSVVSCKALMALSLNDKFQTILLESGAILHLIDMACFYRSAASEEAAGSQKGMDEEKRVRLAASSVLSLLAGFTTPVFHPEPNAQVQRVLSAMLTPDVIATLASPSAFVARVLDNRPQLQPLFKYVEGELIGVKKLGEWPQSQWPFQPLSLNLKPAAPLPPRPQPTPQQTPQARGHGQFSTPNGVSHNADDDADQPEDEQDQAEDDQQGDDQDEDGGEVDEDGNPIPDAYAMSAPTKRVLSPGEKMSEKMSDLGSSMSSSFSNFRNKAKAALTPDRVKAKAAEAEAAAKEAAAKAAVKSKAAANAVQQSEQMKRAQAAAAPRLAAAKAAAAPHLAVGKLAAQVAASEISAAASPHLAAASKAAAPHLAMAKQGAQQAAAEASSMARKAQIDAAPMMRQASLQANKAAAAASAQASKAAAAAAPQLAQAKEAAQLAQQLAAPRLTAAGVTAAAGFASAKAAASRAASSAQAKMDEYAAQPEEYADDGGEEVHSAAEFYGNDAGQLLSPNNLKSPSTQHTPYADASSSSPQQYEEQYDNQDAEYEYNPSNGNGNGHHHSIDGEEQYADQEQYDDQPTEEYDQQPADEEDVQQTPQSAAQQQHTLSPSGRVVLTSR